MIHTIIVFLGLAIGSIAYGMEPVDTSHYFVPGPKNVSDILFRGLQRQLRNVEDMRELVLPIGLTCKMFYKQFDDRCFVQDIIARCAFVAEKSRGSVAVQLKTRPALRYFELNNKLYMATITKYFDDNTLEYVFSLLERGGADPNFGRPGFGTTLLMRAVMLNCVPLVQFLLTECGADANLCNCKGIQARKCNFIYDRGALAHVVESIFDYKLRLKKHLEFHPQKPFYPVDPGHALFAKVDMQELRNALLIDKIFESNKAQSVCDKKSNPLLIVLKKKDSFRSGVIKEMYSNSALQMKLYTPKWLYDFLWAPGP